MRTPFYGYEHSRMWAHYAEGHRGVCFKIDKKEFIKENKKFIKKGRFKNMHYIDFNIKKMPDHREVNYPLDMVGLQHYLKGEFREKHLDYLYFRKTREWASERETRLIYFSENETDEFCSIQNSLSGIYLGLKFNQNYLPSIVNLSGKVPIYEFHYSDDRLIPRELYKL
jgi:hypothetical protein